MELARRKPLLEKSGDSPVGAENHEGEHDGGAGDENQRLHEIAPHDSLDAADGAVKYRNYRNRGNRPVHIDPHYRRKRDGGKIRDDRRSRDHEHDERRRSEQAAGKIEPDLEILVGARQVEFAEKRQVPLHDHRRKDQDPETQREIAHVGMEHLRRDAQERDRRKHRRIERERNRPPRQLPAAAEIIVGRLVPTRKEQPHRHHPGKIDGKDGNI